MAKYYKPTCLLCLLSILFKFSPYAQSEMYKYSYPVKTSIYTVEGDQVLSVEGNKVHWKTADGAWKIINTLTIKEEISPNGVTRLAQSNNGKYIIIAGQNGIALVDGKKRTQIDFFPYRFRNEHVFVGFTSNDSFIIFDPNYYSYTIDTNNKIKPNQQLKLKAAKSISPNCRWLVEMPYTTMTTRNVIVWDLLNGKKASEFIYEFPKNEYPNLLGIDNSGEFIVFEEYLKDPMETKLKVLNRITRKTTLLRTFEPIIFKSFAGTQKRHVKIHVGATQDPKHLFGGNAGHFYYLANSQLLLLDLQTGKEKASYFFEKGYAPTALNADESRCIYFNKIIDLKSGIALGPAASILKLMPVGGSANFPNYFLDDNRIVYGGVNWVNVFDISDLTAKGDTWSNEFSWLVESRRMTPNLNLIPQKNVEPIIFSSSNVLYEWFPNTFEFKECPLEKSMRVENVLPCPGRNLLFLFGEFPENDPRFVKLIQDVMDNPFANKDLGEQAQKLIENLNNPPDSDLVKQKQKQILGYLKKRMKEGQEKILKDREAPTDFNPYGLDSMFNQIESQINTIETVKDLVSANPRKDKILMLKADSLEMVGEISTWLSTHDLEESQVIVQDGIIRKPMKVKTAVKRAENKEIIVGLELASMVVTPDGKYLYTEIQPSQGRVQTHSGAIIKWEIGNNSIRQLKTLAVFGESRIKRNPFYSSMSISKDGSKLIWATDKGKIKIWTIKTDQLLQEFESTDHHFNFATLNTKQDRLITVTSEQEVLLYTFPKFTLIGRHKQQPSPKVKYLEFSPNDSMILTSTRLATTIYKTIGVEEILTMQSVSGKSGGFIAQTPDRYYVSTRGINENPPFEEVENASFSFAQYDLIFNRPDIVLSRILGINTARVKQYEQMYKTRLKHLGLSSELNADKLFAGTQIEVTLYDIPNGTPEEKIDARVKVEIGNIPAKRLVVLVNDVPLPTTEELVIHSVKNTVIEKNIEILLGNGNNKITFFVTTEDGIESPRQVVNCTYLGKTRKPDLYLMSIGVDQYDSLSQLNFPVKDAKDISNLFTSQGKDKYGKINSISFLDDKFSMNTLKKIKAFVKKSKVDDHVIFYYAGHGFTNNGDFYLTTSKSFTGDNFEYCISFKDIEEVFEQAQARNRLILVDACNSGETDPDIAEQKMKENTKKEEDHDLRTTGVSKANVISQDELEIMKRFFVDLRTTSGTNIIAAARGDQGARGSQELGNGIFTHFIIKGTKGRLADTDNIGGVTVEELSNYIFKEVPQYARKIEREQQPTFRVEVLNNKWPVYGY